MILLIKRDNNISMAFGVPGLVLPVIGLLAEAPILNIVGTVLLTVGLVYYAKAKGRHPAWCVLGLLSSIGYFNSGIGAALAFLGLIVLAALPDRAKDGTPPAAAQLATPAR